MAAVFLGAHIVHMELGHRRMENVPIACLMLVTVAFMRAVSQIGNLLLLLRKAEFQTETGQEGEGGISFCIHRNLDFPIAVYIPYRMQAQEGLYVNSGNGKVAGNGYHTLSGFGFACIYFYHTSVVSRFLPGTDDVAVIICRRPVYIPLCRSRYTGFAVPFQLQEAAFFFPEFIT